MSSLAALTQPRGLLVLVLSSRGLVKIAGSNRLREAAAAGEAPEALEAEAAN